jgi:hypothetical protein
MSPVGHLTEVDVAASDIRFRGQSGLDLWLVNAATQAPLVGIALVLGFVEGFAEDKHAFLRIFPSPVGRR